jgi:hypothetical protein
MTDPAALSNPPPAPASRPAMAPALPPELEARIAAFEKAAPRTDFDLASWFWMMILGVAVPLALLIVGWRA